MNIIYQDRLFIVINKETGRLVQGDITRRHSIYQEIKEYTAGMGFSSDPYIGIVHRLDFLVSGVLVIALTKKTASFFSRQFRSRDMHKEYYAVVENTGSAGFDRDREICLYCRREGEKTVILDADSKGSKSVSMFIESVSCNERFQFLRLFPVTGRKHQIRAVLSYFGLPVVGDRKYGSKIPFMKDSIALHCRKIELSLPGKGGRRVFSAGLPFFWEIFDDIIDPCLR